MGGKYVVYWDRFGNFSSKMLLMMDEKGNIKKIVQGNIL